MMCDWGKSYLRIETQHFGSSLLVAWHSPELSDPNWDDFLRSTPCGQFQQSSMWADYKAGEGWNHYRVIITENDAITGGFQMLWRKTRLGRIGYVSKGPVGKPETAILVRSLDDLLKRAAIELGLVALIAQPPDESVTNAAESIENSFDLSNPTGVIEATYLVDVRPEKDALINRMSPSLRRNIRRGGKQAVHVREGTEADLPLFFELMEATCRRQSTKPNPPSLDAVRRLWQAFLPSNSIRLTFADCGGVSPAAKLSLGFGDRLTVWKKGWDGSNSQCHPNELLEADALAWAHDRGYRICDFCSFNRSAAERLIDGQPQAEVSLSTRDEYHFRFGGYPKLLPRARVYVPNPIIGWGYRTAVRVSHSIKSFRSRTRLSGT